jgi:hypothetical protein
MDFSDFRFFSSFIVLYRLFSILRSYIISLSSTLLFEKSIWAIRPRSSWGKYSQLPQVTA